MKEYEPTRWQTTKPKREDMRDLDENNVQPPMQTFSSDKFVLKDETRQVDFLHLGWGTHEAMAMCGCRRSECCAPAMRR